MMQKGILVIDQYFMTNTNTNKYYKNNAQDRNQLNLTCIIIVYLCCTLLSLQRYPTYGGLTTVLFQVTVYPFINFVGAKVKCLKPAIFSLFCAKSTSKFPRRTLQNCQVTSDKLSFNLLTNAKVTVMAFQLIRQKKILAKAQLTLITF